MEHHRLHASGDERVADGQVDGEGLVTAGEIGGAGLVRELLLGHRLPDWAPFGAGRGHHIVDAEIAEGLEYGVAPIG